jgi:hypothetical protein
VQRMRCLIGHARSHGYNASPVFLKKT